MATLTFSFDTGTVPLNRIIDAIALQGGYRATIDGQPNSETKAQFARRLVQRFIVNMVKVAETQIAEATARAGVEDIPLV